MAEGGGKVPLNENPELLKPLIFGNHQRGFKIFNYIVAAGEIQKCYIWHMLDDIMYSLQR